MLHIWLIEMETCVLYGEMRRAQTSSESDWAQHEYHELRITVAAGDDHGFLPEDGFS